MLVQSILTIRLAVARRKNTIQLKDGGVTVTRKRKDKVNSGFSDGFILVVPDVIKNARKISLLQLGVYFNVANFLIVFGCRVNADIGIAGILLTPIVTCEINRFNDGLRIITIRFGYSSNFFDKRIKTGCTDGGCKSYSLVGIVLPCDSVLIEIKCDCTLKIRKIEVLGIRLLEAIVISKGIRCGWMGSGCPFIVIRVNFDIEEGARGIFFNTEVVRTCGISVIPIAGILRRLRRGRVIIVIGKYSLQGTTQGRYLTGGVPPVRFSM